MSVKAETGHIFFIFSYFYIFNNSKLRKLLTKRVRNLVSCTVCPVKAFLCFLMVKNSNFFLSRGLNLTCHIRSKISETSNNKLKKIYIFQFAISHIIPFISNFNMKNENSKYDVRRGKMGEGGKLSSIISAFLKAEKRVTKDSEFNFDFGFQAHIQWGFGWIHDPKF
jgi:hypothetical protein